MGSAIVWAWESKKMANAADMGRPVMCPAWLRHGMIVLQETFVRNQSCQICLPADGMSAAAETMRGDFGMSRRRLSGNSTTLFCSNEVGARHGSLNRWSLPVGG